MSFNPASLAIHDLMNQDASKIHDPNGNRAKDLIRNGGIGTSTKPGRYWITAVAFFLLIVLGVFLLSRAGSSSMKPLGLEELKISKDSKNRYLSTVEQLGETIRLAETGSGVWQISRSATGTRSLKFDPATKYYKYTGADCTIWFRYNTNYKQPRWQCWYLPISGDYDSQYGWMELRDGSWYVESAGGKWIVLPDQYDTSSLFYIQVNE